MLCSHFRPAKGGTRCTPGRAMPKAPACPASPHLPLPAECVCDSQDNRPEEGGLDVTSESVFQPQPAPLGMATPHAERVVSGGTHQPLLQRAGRRAEKTRTSRPDCVPRPPRAHSGERGGRRRAGPGSVQRRQPRVLWRRGRRGVHSLRRPGGHTPGPASQGK